MSELTAGPQPTAAATREAPTEPARVFDDELGTLVRAVLDRLVPPIDDLPGAGALGVAGLLEATLAKDPALRRTFLEGFRAIEIAGGGSIDDQVLRRIERERPGFFAALVNHCYRGYYTHPLVLRRLEARHGYAARPPQPLGHELPAWDDALLARQRERAPFWRKTPSS